MADPAPSEPFSPRPRPRRLVLIGFVGLALSSVVPLVGLSLRRQREREALAELAGRMEEWLKFIEHRAADGVSVGAPRALADGMGSITVTFTRLVPGETEGVFERRILAEVELIGELEEPQGHYLFIPVIELRVPGQRPRDIGDALMKAFVRPDVVDGKTMQPIDLALYLEGPATPAATAGGPLGAATAARRE